MPMTAFRFCALRWCLTAEFFVVFQIRRLERGYVFAGKIAVMEFSFLFLGFVYFETRGYLGDIYFYPIILLVKPINRQGYS